MKLWPFSLLSKKQPIKLEILFGKESNGTGAHGTLIASHAHFGPPRDIVNFAFVGTSVPKMTAEVLTFITDQAERKGYTVHYLRSYMSVVQQPSSPFRNPPAPNMVPSKQSIDTYIKPEPRNA